MTDAEWQDFLNGSNAILGGLLGYNLDNYRNVQGQSGQDFANRWTSGLGSLGGYYDANQVNSLIGGLGGTSSTTYLNQLSALSTEANRVYSYIQNPDSVTAKLSQAAKANGGFVTTNFGSGYRDDGRNSFYYDAMGNRYDVLMSPVMKQLYTAVDTIKARQDELGGLLTAQQQKEQSFVTQINQITQQATLAKSKAEQAAAQKALQDQYAQQQAQLDKQAQDNAAALAKQQAEQQAQYEKAQAEAEENARKQQLALDTTAQTAAITNATNAQQQQARQSVSQLEQQASQVRGGEASVSTNAAATKGKRGNTSRTERWQSARQPAPGGGGIRA